MKTQYEILCDQIKGAAWLNETRTIVDCLASPQLAIAFLSIMHDEHYITEDSAAKSMEYAATTLNVPMRLWRTPRGRLFFAHALLSATEFGCECIASHHPIPA
jgi:hypothetical protein